MLNRARMSDVTKIPEQEAKARARVGRRRFCAGLVVLGASACSSSSKSGATDDLGTDDLALGSSSCAAASAAGDAASVVEGTPVYVSSLRVFVCRDAGGLYAMSSLCTHQGCTLQLDVAQLYCDCHGATFDLNGENPTSPARKPLVHYAVCVDASGTVQVDKTQTVAASTRA